MHHTNIQSFANPDSSFDQPVTQNSQVLGSNPVGWIVFIEVVHIYIYAVFQTIQRYGVCSAVYGTVLYDSMREGHSPDFGLLSVVILPFFCRKRSRYSLTNKQDDLKSVQRRRRCTSINPTLGERLLTVSHLIDTLSHGVVWGYQQNGYDVTICLDVPGYSSIRLWVRAQADVVTSFCS